MYAKHLWQTCNFSQTSLDHCWPGSLPQSPCWGRRPKIKAQDCVLPWQLLKCRTHGTALTQVLCLYFAVQTRSPGQTTLHIKEKRCGCYLSLISRLQFPASLQNNSNKLITSFQQNQRALKPAFHRPWSVLNATLCDVHDTQCLSPGAVSVRNWWAAVDLLCPGSLWFVQPTPHYSRAGIPPLSMPSPHQPQELWLTVFLRDLNQSSVLSNLQMCVAPCTT